jgi:hypothetical protein
MGGRWILAQPESSAFRVQPDQRVVMWEGLLPAIGSPLALRADLLAYSLAAAVEEGRDFKVVGDRFAALP